MWATIGNLAAVLQITCDWIKSQIFSLGELTKLPASDNTFLISLLIFSSFPLMHLILSSYVLVSKVSASFSLLLRLVKSMHFVFKSIFFSVELLPLFIKLHLWLYKSAVSLQANTKAVSVSLCEWQSPESFLCYQLLLFTVLRMKWVEKKNQNLQYVLVWANVWKCRCFTKILFIKCCHVKVRVIQTQLLLYLNRKVLCKGK